MAQAWERWNTHFSTQVEQEVMGRTLHLAQDPNSEHLGTTVWDVSVAQPPRRGACTPPASAADAVLCLHVHEAAG